MNIVLGAVTAFNAAQAIEVQASANTETLDIVETPFGTPTAWILKTGVWNDEGFWDEDAFWRD